MHNLADRTNIDYFNFEGKPVVIFESHRTTLQATARAGEYRAGVELKLLLVEELFVCTNARERDAIVF